MFNDQVNRDAASDVPTSETADGGSGSTPCSPIATEDVVVRYFEYSTLCQVCDLLGLPHPKQHSIHIKIEINVTNEAMANEKVTMTEECSFYSAVPVHDEPDSFAVNFVT
jgi:hypothetical protein